MLTKLWQNVGIGDHSPPIISLPPIRIRPAPLTPAAIAMEIPHATYGEHDATDYDDGYNVLGIEGHFSGIENEM